MNISQQIRPSRIAAIPAAVIAAIAIVHWSGAWSGPQARARSNAPAVAPSGADCARPAWQQNWSSDLPRRNLFETRLDNFPRDVGTAQQPMRPAASGEDLATGAKSPAVLADHDSDESQSAMQAQIKGIHLQSTMMRPAPRALVNGQIVGEGDFVGSFRVVRISLSQIVLEKQGLEFEITLK